MAPNHYLNKCWLLPVIISKIFIHLRAVHRKCSGYIFYLILIWVWKLLMQDNSHIFHLNLLFVPYCRCSCCAVVCMTTCIMAWRVRVKLWSNIQTSYVTNRVPSTPPHRETYRWEALILHTDILCNQQSANHVTAQGNIQVRGFDPTYRHPM